MTIQELRKFGVEVEEPARQRLERFVHALLDENSRLNLTAIRTPESAWVLHVCDSLAPLTRLGGLRPGSIVDVGTGGGAPGIPLACVMSDWRVTLVDGTSKKIAACRRIAASCELQNVEAIAGRAEELAGAHDLRERFDIAVARAIGPLNKVLEYLAGFVAVGGECWAFKTPASAEAERPAAAALLAPLGLREAGSVEYDLGDLGGKRCVLVFRKVAKCASRYPRRGGTAGGAVLRPRGVGRMKRDGRADVG
ncbi:MAG: 16S rRNA (guanine(527)-N(7))-methyltransferase RsmG [Phycisphaerales bacterium]|nr:16S rRNA (guanine(527)-N(7))-methyltransferase RsmG [Phycisphaerales bacterium]